MISARPPKAARGRPPPSTFPKHDRSGSTPKRPWAPSSPRRKPVMTSSMISRAPAAEHRGPGRPGDRLDHPGVGVAEDRRPPRLHEVEITAAVGVPDRRALGPGGEERFPADGPEGPHRRVHAPGDPGQSPPEELAGHLGDTPSPGRLKPARPGGGRSR